MRTPHKRLYYTVKLQILWEFGTGESEGCMCSKIKIRVFKNDDGVTSWTVFPSIHRLKSQPLLPQKETTFEGRALNRWLSYSEVFGVGLIQNDWCPYKRRKFGQTGDTSQGLHRKTTMRRCRKKVEILREMPQKKSSLPTPRSQNRSLLATRTMRK